MILQEVSVKIQFHTVSKRFFRMYITQLHGTGQEISAYC